MHVSVKFYSSVPLNNVTVRHYLDGFILVFGLKIIVPLGHNSSKYGNTFFIFVNKPTHHYNFSLLSNFFQSGERSQWNNQPLSLFLNTSLCWVTNLLITITFFYWQVFSWLAHFAQMNMFACLNTYRVCLTDNWLCKLITNNW